MATALGSAGAAKCVLEAQLIRSRDGPLRIPVGRPLLERAPQPFGLGQTKWLVHQLQPVLRLGDRPSGEGRDLAAKKTAPRPVRGSFHEFPTESVAYDIAGNGHQVTVALNGRTFINSHFSAATAQCRGAPP